MRITQFFHEVLQAQLTNTQWSWGAENKTSRVLFFRVWRDQVEPFRVQVDWPGEGSRLGRNERARHLEMMQNGQPTFGVICDAKPLPDGEYERTIIGFEKEKLLRLGLPLKKDRDGVTWATILDRVDFESLSKENGLEAAVCQDIAEIKERKLSATQKQQLVDARLGQGGFREDLLKIWNRRCAVTGSTTVEAVRASHILPWRESNDTERLDPHNGLLLTAGIDALFDRYLVTFGVGGKMLVSASINQAERKLLGLNGRKLLKTISRKTIQYLAKHRAVFDELEALRKS